jgi:hypothetical protein
MAAAITARQAGKSVVLVEQGTLGGTCVNVGCVQLALDSLVAPGLVLSGHPFDQGGDRVVDGRAFGPVRVGPLLGDQAAVPPQDRGRSDQAMTAQHTG